MPAGLRTWNADGSPALSIDDRVLRLLTVASVGTTASGSVIVPGLADGTAVIQARNGASSTYRAPQVGVTGTTVSWDYGSIPMGSRDPDLALEIQVY